MVNSKYLVRIEAHMKLDIDLYRGGNSSHPRFDNLRPKDIVKWKDKETGETWVEKESGGISTFDYPKPEKNWWWIRAGTPVPEGIVVTRDRTDSENGITHYTLRPANDMREADYISSMQELVDVTDPTSKLELEEAVKLGGRWINKHR